MSELNPGLRSGLALERWAQAQWLDGSRRRPAALLIVGLFLGWAGPLQAQVELTEFMASNTRTLRDDFGQYEDWIEIYNRSAASVNLQGWALTDRADNRFKWRFPSTNLPPHAYQVVFASGRDRGVPGATLHTNFRLDAAGEYLALVRPDGTIATEFAPSYPPQASDVSFGFGTKPVGRLLVTTNATGQVQIPVDATLGTGWTAVGFDATPWRAATNGIGFELGQNDDPATVSARVLADQPVGYWRLDGAGAGLAVNAGSLGEAANGQALGGVAAGGLGPRDPAWPGFEPGNLAARFNGTDGRIEVPYSPALNPPDAFTVEAWVRPARVGGSPAWVVSSLNVSNGRTGYALAQDYSAKNQWEFRLGDAAGYIAAAYGGTVDTNRWQYVVGVYDGATARLYVDGALAASATLARPFAPNTAQKLILGGRVDAANPYYYAGDLDEVSVIPRALTAGEVDARFQMAVNGGPSGSAFNYAGRIQTDLQTSLFGVNSAAYLRLPFTVTHVADLDQLTLRVQYDDGFVGYLNGQLVAAANAPPAPAWNSVATARHAASDAVRFEEFDLTGQLEHLREGANVLALQGLNLAATNADFLLCAELEAVGGQERQSQSRYFVMPTPRSANGTGARDLGPMVSEVGHRPSVPCTNDSIRVTCRVAPTFVAVTNVTLHWRVMFEALQATPMFDDGLHEDGAAGDGLYGAVIPSQQGANWTYRAGQMVRWYVVATDAQGRTSRWPLFETAQDSEEYLGTVVEPDYVASKLPVFHLFAPPTVLQPGPATQQIGADSETGGRVALFYDGEFYDNIYMELRGNTSAGLNKKAHRLEFNREHPFRHPGPGGRVRKSSLLAEHLDPAYLRQHLCFWLLDLNGVPSPFNYPVRTQLNGAFYQLAFHTDVLGEEQLDRLGYDAAGALYKCVGQVDLQFSSTGGFQKLLPRTNLNDRADYLVLANGINESRPLAARRASVFDLLDVAQVVNYLAGARFCAENDDVWANMCLYRDTWGDGLWRIVPFDMNASWGQLYGGNSPLSAANDNSKSHPFYGGSQVQENGASAWNRIYDVIIALPETRDMLLRRQRTLLDSWVLPPGTPTASLILENYIRQMTNQIWVEAQLDRQKWGLSPWAPGKQFPNAINDLLLQFVGPRRQHWYVTHCVTNTAKRLGVGPSLNAGIPLSQPGDAAAALLSWDYNPASGNQDEQFVCLTNQNPFAVDVSGWDLGGGVQFTLKAGTVIPAGGALYLSPNVAAFRNRSSAPRGGMGLFVQGSYRGRLNAWGDRLTLADATGRLVSSNRFVGAPSLAQRYLRITEIMYHPAPLPGSPLDPELFEYLELKNLSPDVTLDLTGVSLTQGVAFRFTGSGVTTVPPGGTVLVVRDLQAFALRYGSQLLVAGPFEGALDGAGETLRLEDAVGQPILDFAYGNHWYPTTDGLGFSLVVVDEQAPWSDWGRRANWRPSADLQGSPGERDPPAPAIPSIRINEVLAHPGPSDIDAIELFNPTATAAEVGGWLLTDDPAIPAKYRLPEGTAVPPAGYLVLTADQFGAGPNGFRLSRYGDQVQLFSADAATNLTGYSHGFDFACSPEGVSLGRHVTSEGDEHFVLQSASTLGTANGAPRVGPVVISEVFYRPPDLANRLDNHLDEYLELQNLTGTNVPLSCVVTTETGTGSAALTNTWRLRNAVDYDFPPNATLAPGARLLVVGFDPVDLVQLAAFRQRYSVTDDVPVFGPWEGKLDNSGETIELKAPDWPAVTATNVIVPYVMVDQVAYRDAAPWPVNADGVGASLQRRDLAAYGNDPANWFAASPTAGLATRLPPLIIVQPEDQTATVGRPAGFSVQAGGSAPLSYQWLFEAAPIPGATTTNYGLAAVQRSEGGRYRVVVTNAFGSAVSANALLTVTVPTPLLDLTLDGAQLSFSLPSGVGFTYVLEYKNDLNESTWTSLSAPAAGTGDRLFFRADTAPSRQRFYRIRTF